MGRRPILTAALAIALASFANAPGAAQTLSQRGFGDVRITLFPQETATDHVQAMADVIAREEVFAKAAGWLQFTGGIDLRQNTHEQVEATIDIRDRGEKRPAVSIRRLAAAIAHGPVTIDLGKQFIRWGKADIVTPTDRFAPRDFLNVIDTELLGVSGARGSVAFGAQTLDVVWTLFTPSRVPLVNQRWAQNPSAAIQVPGTVPGTGAVAVGTIEAIVPDGTQAGIRFSRTGRIEYSLSFFNGFNHLPNIEAAAGPEPGSFQLIRRYPTMRSYGGDAAVPTRWFTLKGEAAYSTSDTPATDDYVLYVVQLERISGEWQFAGGYAGEVVTARRAVATFAPDRGLTRSIVARAGYTIDSNRAVAIEGAVRQNGDGVYSKIEYSQARGEHWRGTITGVIIAGDRDDFLGQYNRNSHIAIGLRYSF